MPADIGARIFLTRAALESLPAVLGGVTLDNPDGIPTMGGHHRVVTDDGGWIRIDAVPDGVDMPDDRTRYVQLRFPATSVAGVHLFPDHS